MSQEGVDNSCQLHGEGGPETGTLEHPVPRSEMGPSLLQVGPFLGRVAGVLEVISFKRINSVFSKGLI
jgi:hypothetical protein